ncbi:MAG: SMC-Scp complex subunit ScpB [Candidatus Woesearchaeota archaeon]
MSGKQKKVDLRIKEKKKSSAKKIVPQKKDSATKKVIPQKAQPTMPLFEKKKEEMQAVQTKPLIMPIPVKQEFPIAPVSIEQTQKTIVEEKKEPLITQAKPSIEKKIVSQSEKDENLIEDKNKIEALLFASGKYIEEDTLSELCGIDKRRLHKILDQLKRDYESRDNALTIFNESNAWKINVREKYLSVVRKIVADTELPKSVMETLAVIAWKSPIYQSEVVRIRGNKCYDHIEVLEEAGFIIKDKKGRSYVLKTTDKFYNYFEIDHGNLKSVFETVKIPVKEEQKTLDEEVKVPENLTINEKIEQIQVKKWTETSEERESHNKFLEEIDGKIKEVSEKNSLLEEEFPSRRKQEQTVSEIIPEQSTGNGEMMPQENTPVLEDKKTKPLTKKQLEKKFKDELSRVREKMEKK